MQRAQHNTSRSTVISITTRERHGRRKAHARNPRALASSRAAETTSKVVAERLVAELEASGFVLMRRPIPNHCTREWPARFRGLARLSRQPQNSVAKALAGRAEVAQPQCSVRISASQVLALDLAS